MKKFILSAAIAVSAASMISCGGSAPKADLKNDVDTLSYAFGLAQGQQLPQYLAQQGIDSTYYAEIIKGINDAINAGEDKSKAAYYAGLQLGQMIGNQWVPGVSREVFGEDTTQTVSVKNLLAGFLTPITGEKNIVDPMIAQEIFQKKSDAIKEADAAKKYAAEKKNNDEAMAKIAKAEGVKPLANGVYYKVLSEGKGEKPTAEASVKINYEGKLLINDTIFDSSYQRNEPQTMPVAGVVPGFREALLAMPVGSKWEVYIPSDQGYGYREMGGKIPPFSALKFTIELLEIVNAQQPQMMPVQMQ